MIRPLRQRHRRMVTGLCVLLPLAFVAALLARRPIPILEAPVAGRVGSITLTNHTETPTGVPLQP